MTVKERVLAYAKRTYGTVPDRPFATAPTYEVLRHEGSKKWYALFMDIPANKLGLQGEEKVDIINLKCDPILAGSLRDGVGIFPGYHLNHASWITVLLDGTVDIRDICPLVDISYTMTGGRSGKIRDWLIPANPAYYDLEKALRQDMDRPFIWKQSSNIAVGDRVYIYMAAPERRIRYKCEAVEVNIPHDYEDGNVTMKRVMRLKLLRRYDEREIGVDMLRDHGVYAVRGPRSMPGSLIEEIERIYGE